MADRDGMSDPWESNSAQIKIILRMESDQINRSNIEESLNKSNPREYIDYQDTNNW